MKNLIITCFALLSLSICFSSCGDGDIDYTIYPGQGVGELKIGDLGSVVFDALGKDFETIVNVGTSGNANYNYYSEDRGIDIVFGQQNSGDLDINTLPVKGFILFEGFEGLTTAGITIGSTRDEVIAAHGEPDEIDTTFFEINVYYVGMLITYNDDDLVSRIIIQEI